jgi:hypothetical protein
MINKGDFLIMRVAGDDPCGLLRKRHLKLGKEKISYYLVHGHHGWLDRVEHSQETGEML